MARNTNQYWQLAVAGNITNSYFPSNDVQRVSGSPDAVLGHYGVDTTNRLVWANVNYGTEFAVFGPRIVPAGTIFKMR